MSSPIDFSTTIDYSKLKDKNVLITGSCSGLGEGFTRMFAKSGATVVIADQNQETSAKVEQDLIQAGHKALYIHADVASWDSQVSLFRQALAYFPNNEIDILVTSAGIGRQYLDSTPQSYQNLDSNLATTFGMGLEKRSADADTYTKSIILIGSAAGYTGGFTPAPDYMASKFGVRGLFNTSWRPLAEMGIRVNLLAPFFVETPLTAPSIEIVKKMGFEPASMEDNVAAIARFAANEEVVGRAVLVTFDGLLDFGDDAEGLRGGKVMWELEGSLARYIKGDLADQVPPKVQKS